MTFVERWRKSCAISKVSEGGCMVLRRSLALALVVAFAASAAPVPDLKTLARESLAKIDGDLSMPGLREPVEIIRDKWGVTHIYAKNQEDMFFAQGFVAGQDRLWELYMWRMTNEGRLAEILGPGAFDRDKDKRMSMYRRQIDDEEW